MRRVLLAAALMAGMMAGTCAEPVRVGLLLTLSGPSAAPGRHARDGFMLALKQMDNQLGDRPAEVTVLDDARNVPAVGALVQGFIKQHKPAAIVGPLTADLIGPALKAATDGQVLMLGPGSGPADLAGKRCQPNFFSLSGQDDMSIEVIARHAEETRLTRAVIVSTTGEAADTAATAFKRAFKGEVLDRIAIDAAVSDFSEQINRIDIHRPQAVFLHLAGEAGLRFMRQFVASGAATGLTLLGSSGFDAPELAELGEAAAGILSAGDWAYGLPTPGNEAFVRAFEAEFGYAPGAVALHAYDAARLLDSALRLSQAVPADRVALADAMKQADVESPRGKFAFGNNNFPIQDLYLTRVEARGDGKVRTAIVRQVFAQYGDHYASECPLK